MQYPSFFNKISLSGTSVESYKSVSFTTEGNQTFEKSLCNPTDCFEIKIIQAFKNPQSPHPDGIAVEKLKLSREATVELVLRLVFQSFLCGRPFEI